MILPFLFVVEQQTAAIVQAFGKFARVAEPGLHFKIPFVEVVAGKVNLRVRQLDVEVETKTLDNVTGAWIQDQEVVIDKGKIKEYRVRMKVTFILKD